MLKGSSPTIFTRKKAVPFPDLFCIDERLNSMHWSELTQICSKKIEFVDDGVVVADRPFFLLPH
jgi:hypothetical protein